MREHEYRVWDKENKKMNYVGSIPTLRNKYPTDLSKKRQVYK